MGMGRARKLEQEACHEACSETGLVMRTKSATLQPTGPIACLQLKILTCRQLIQQAAQAPHIAGGADALAPPPVVIALLLVPGTRTHGQHLRRLEAIGSAGARGGNTIHAIAAEVEHTAGVEAMGDGRGDNTADLSLTATAVSALHPVCQT